MLSIYLTEDLEQAETQAQDMELLFYFCCNQDEKRNTATAVLRGLIYQIIVKRPSLVYHILPYFESPQKRKVTIKSPDALWVILRKLIQDPSLSDTFCVIDGLDECDSTSVNFLVTKIVSFYSPQGQEQACPHFKLLIVSRDILPLQGLPRIRLDAANAAGVEHDIDRFIAAGIKQLSRIDGFDQKVLDHVNRELVARSEGTFLWIGFVMNELIEKRTCVEVLDTLHTLPSGLHAIYNRMLLQIDDRQRKLSAEILKWVTLSVRPLKLKELAAAVGLRTVENLSVEQTMRDQVSLCGPLLEVYDDHLQIVHQSVRDYLIRRGRDRNSGLELFRVDYESAHLQIAQRCIDEVQNGVQKIASDESDAEQYLQDRPLLDYATMHWPEHARFCGLRGSQLLDHSPSFFSKNSTLLGTWAAAYDVRKMNSWPLDAFIKRPAGSRLHIASRHGISPWLERLLKERRWKHPFHKPAVKRNAFGEMPLALAVFYGHEEAARLLVQHGATYNDHDRRCRTPLSYAAEGGHEMMIRLMLEQKHIEADFKDELQKTPLLYAAGRGHEGVVRLLVSRADVEADSKDYDGRTPLSHAAENGHEGVVRILVERTDVEADSKDDDNRTPLSYAAEQGHEGLVRLLLERGDVEADSKQTRYLWTPIFWAAAKGHGRAVQMLSERKDVDAYRIDTLGQTPVSCAAMAGHESIVQLLLEQRNIAADEYSLDALNLAVLKGNREVVEQLLFYKGIRLNPKLVQNWTPLLIASVKGYEGIVRLLLEQIEIEFGSGDLYSLTLRNDAAALGHTEIVRLLMGKLTVPTTVQY